MARDLEKDLEICQAATPGPWVVDEHLANSIRQPRGSNRRRISTPPDADGLTDAQFISEARAGWPYAIRRALEAEERVEKLEHELRMLQDHLNHQTIS